MYIIKPSFMCINWPSVSSPLARGHACSTLNLSTPEGSSALWSSRRAFCSAFGISSSLGEISSSSIFVSAMLGAAPTTSS